MTPPAVAVSAPSSCIFTVRVIRTSPRPAVRLIASAAFGGTLIDRLTGTPSNPMAAMARLLITGTSGAGKTTVLQEVSRRGYRTIDADYDGWVLPDDTWDE